jgi:hypothetical protein
MQVTSPLKNRARAKSLVKQLKRVFDAPGAPPPAIAVIPQSRKINQPSAEKFAQALAGRSWSELPLEFGAEYWSYYGYLSPAGWRHYLPALLKTALFPLATQDQIHSVVYTLGPDWWGLYFNRGRQDTDARDKALTPKQREFVAAILDLALDVDGVLCRSAAAALRFRWNREPSRGLKRALALYRRWTSFRRPRVPARVASMVKQIDEAFASRKPPRNWRLTDSKQGDEPSELAMQFRGTDWRTLHPEFLNYNHACLSFFTGRGFAYFLPAYVIGDLLRLTNNDPVFHLTYGLARDLPKEEDLRQYAQEKLSVFTAKERSALVAYLEHKAANSSFDAPAIAEALPFYRR